MKTILISVLSLIIGSFIFFQKNISSVNPFIGNIFIVICLICLLIIGLLFFNEKEFGNKIIQISIFIVCLFGSLIKARLDFKAIKQQDQSSRQFEQNQLQD